MAFDSFFVLWYFSAGVLHNVFSSPCAIGSPVGFSPKTVRLRASRLMSVFLQSIAQYYHNRIALLSRRKKRTYPQFLRF